MSDTKSTQDWMKDWQALQGQYWTAWTDATRGVAANVPDPATPWHEGFEQWARMFGDSGKQSETLDRLMASAKGYSALMQSMVNTAAGKPMGANAPQAWADALRQGFNIPGADAFLANNPLAQMLRGIRGPGVQSFGELSASFAPFLAQAKEEGKSWLNVPAFGYLREHQEHYQKMAAAFVEYQEAMGRYNELILKASQHSFEIIQDKLAARDEPGRQIESPRALYDLWVDAAEEAYAEIALSDEFRKVYGDVVNTQMRVRSQIQQEVERVGVDLGMPTRTELNSVHKRLHEMRRAGKSGNDKRVDQLQREVAELRAEVAALKQRAAPALKQRAEPPVRPVAAHTPKHKAVKTAKKGK
jgi:class III poly(R)-hydroxyalkanoic acid synthase PhaE subunit